MIMKVAGGRGRGSIEKGVVKGGYGAGHGSSGRGYKMGGHTVCVLSGRGLWLGVAQPQHHPKWAWPCVGGAGSPQTPQGGDPPIPPSHRPGFVLARGPQMCGRASQRSGLAPSALERSIPIVLELSSPLRAEHPLSLLWSTPRSGLPPNVVTEHPPRTEAESGRQGFLFSHLSFPAARCPQPWCL